jgi:D-alanyl-D-alanine carboxypeptidase
MDCPRKEFPCRTCRFLLECFQHIQDKAMHSSQPDSALRTLLDSLGITAEVLARRGLPFHAEATTLVVAETDAAGREFRLIPQASLAWWNMKQAAREDDIVIEIVSAFRSLERQADIIRAKLAKDMPVDIILTLSAPPGYSEHHTGRAVDINTPGCEATEEPFELIDAFRWLVQHAGRFGFTMSYPRGNSHGFIYEPWHWCYQLS